MLKRLVIVVILAFIILIILMATGENEVSDKPLPEPPDRFEELSGTVSIGFSTADDLFSCDKPGSATLESIDAEGNRQAMKWSFDYASQPSWCARELRAGELGALDVVRFQAHSDRENPLWFQIEQSDGAAYYAWVPIETEWNSISLTLSELSPVSEESSETIDAGKIVKVLLLDPAGQSGASGKRTVWFLDWQFAKAMPMEANQERIVVQGRRLKTGKVGMSAVPQNYQDTKANWLKIFAKSQEAGVQLLAAGNANWEEEIEPSPGVFDWSGFDRFFAVADSGDFDFEYSFDVFGVFFHEEVRVPQHVAFKSFSDPVFVDRFQSLLKSFLDRFGKRTSYLVIHAEGAYSYFDRHPEQLEAYCEFLSMSRAYIKAHSPHIMVGVNTDPGNKDEVLSELSNFLDFISFDVLKGVAELKEPSDLDELIARLVRLAGGKRIAIQNGGWSTAEVDNSSNEEQVEFIKEFYRVLFKYRDDIEYASFHLLYDENEAMMRPYYKTTFRDAPDSFVERMIQTNARFGVFEHDGSPKPGWYELKKQITEYYERIEH